MRITHLAASNWRNFKNVEFDVGERLFVVGPNTPRASPTSSTSSASWPTSPVKVAGSPPPSIVGAA